jgi:ketosteroid isomerase-like protein
VSQETVETVRSVFDAWAKGDLAAGLELYDPDIVFVGAPGNPDGRRFVGLDEVTAWMRRWLQAWTEFTMTAEELIDAGDTVFVHARQRGVGKESGIASESVVFMLWSFRGGRVIRLQQYGRRDEALSAAGL